MVREWLGGPATRVWSSGAWLGTRASVAAAFAVALLSIATGLVTITDPAFAGPLAAFVPPLVQQTAGFTGTLTGFVMLLGAFALRRGYRAGWVVTVVFLPVTAAQGLLQASAYSLPLVVASLVALPVLALNRRHFARQLDLTTNQLAALSALAGAQAYGTVGAFTLRDQFTGIATLTDAYYFTLVTGSTVGYGDITPTTPTARLFAASALLLNVSAFAVALGVLLTPAIEARLSRALGRMTDTQLELLEDHVVVLGSGELTEPILEELHGVDFVVVTADEETARRLADRDVRVLTADPSDESSQERVGIDRARAVIAATNNDAEDALSILTARQLYPDCRIVAAATQRENVGKLRRAGADSVISPATIGGHLLVESALGSEDSERVADQLAGTVEGGGEGDGDGDDDDVTDDDEAASGDSES